MAAGVPASSSTGITRRLPSPGRPTPAPGTTEHETPPRARNRPRNSQDHSAGNADRGRRASRRRRTPGSGPFWTLDAAERAAADPDRAGGTPGRQPADDVEFNQRHGAARLGEEV